MKFTTTAYTQTDKEIEVTQEELQNLIKAMKTQFLSHIEYSSVYDRKSSYYDEEQFVIDFCEKHNIDVSYRVSRVAFFKSLLENLNINASG